MDLSALIFVALAVAWAVYLVPKALKQHEAGESARSVESFSGRLRVLSRRTSTETPLHAESSSGRAETPGTPETPENPETVVRRGPSPAARRRRVLGVILLALVVVGVLAATAVIGWAWIAAPAAVLVAWLVACRLMVRRERSTRPSQPRPAASVVAPGEPRRARVEAPAPEGRVEDLVAGADDHTDQIWAQPEAGQQVEQVPVEFDPETGAPVAWDPVPVTLPTYVAKEPAARRTVRTIDLDSTGVWTSGRHEADSALAREAEQTEREARAARRDQEAAEADRRRASGS